MMPHEPDAAPIPRVFDLDCHRCGYSLRGLRHDEVCPECGQAAWISVEMSGEGRSLDTRRIRLRAMISFGLTLAVNWIGVVYTLLTLCKVREARRTIGRSRIDPRQSKDLRIATWICYVALLISAAVNSFVFFAILR